jgi:hypothetical protein
MPQDAGAASIRRDDRSAQGAETSALGSQAPIGGFWGRVRTPWRGHAAGPATDADRQGTNRAGRRDVPAAIVPRPRNYRLSVEAWKHPGRAGRETRTRTAKHSEPGGFDPIMQEAEPVREGYHALVRPCVGRLPAPRPPVTRRMHAVCHTGDGLPRRDHRLFRRPFMVLATFGAR